MNSTPRRAKGYIARNEQGTVGPLYRALLGRGRGAMGTANPSGGVRSAGRRDAQCSARFQWLECPVVLSPSRRSCGSQGAYPRASDPSRSAPRRRASQRRERARDRAPRGPARPREPNAGANPRGRPAPSGAMRRAQRSRSFATGPLTPALSPEDGGKGARSSRHPSSLRVERRRPGRPCPRGNGGKGRG